MGLRIKKAKKVKVTPPAAKAKTMVIKKRVKPPAKSKKAKGDADKRGLSIGKETGMGVTEYWNKLLTANYRKKLTDDQLVKTFRKEFPRREIVQPIGRVRNFFNRNILGYGDNSGKNRRGTPKQSYAYDKDGKESFYTNWETGRKKNPAKVKAGKLRAKKRWAKKSKPKLKIKSKSKSKAAAKKAA